MASLNKYFSSLVNIQSRKCRIYNVAINNAAIAAHHYFDTNQNYENIKNMNQNENTKENKLCVINASLVSVRSTF
jgi:hypothetical protein